jgi:hypothetical protein
MSISNVVGSKFLPKGSFEGGEVGEVGWRQIFRGVVT